MDKLEHIERRRPYCPKCSMRMIAARPEAQSFQCFRCGYLGPANPAGQLLREAE